MREVAPDGAKLDAGPTVFTMRWVFDEILQEAGVSLKDRLVLRPLETLARHAWRDGSRLDFCSQIPTAAPTLSSDFAGRAGGGEAIASSCKRAERDITYAAQRRSFAQSEAQSV